MSSLRVLTTQPWYPWLVWGVAAAAFFIEYFARVAPGVMVDSLMRDWNIRALALGNLSAFFYYAYVSMQLPVGILVDRFAPGRLGAAMLGVCALGCILFAGASHIRVAALARLIMGFGAAFAFISALKLASLWFPARQFGLLAGSTQALGMLGAAAAQAPLALLANLIGWRQAMVLLALFMLILALVMMWVIQDKEDRQLSDNIIFSSHVGLSLTQVLRVSQNWWNALFAGLLYAPTAVLAELWGVKFYRQVYDISNEMAALAIGMIFIGWAVGGPLIGWLSDYLKARRFLLQLSSGLSLVVISVALFVPHLPLLALFSILFLYGFVNTGVAVAYVVAAESNVHHFAGTAVAFANIVSILIGAAFQPLIGGVLDYSWDYRFKNGVPWYTPQGFKMAMVVLPICLILAFLISFKIKESYPSGKK